ncbi:hypothetical protein [Flavobacterium pedocola]
MLKLNPTLILFLILISCNGTNEKNKFENSNSAITQIDTQKKAQEKPKTKPLLSENGFLFNIEGIYLTTENEIECQIKLEIFKENETLKYKFKTPKKDLTGEVSVSLNEKKDGYYLSLKGIQWSEYEGTIEYDENGEEIENEYELPKDLKGILYENQIVIQNTGNSMNYYVQLAECDLKYIYLNKK